MKTHTPHADFYTLKGMIAKGRPDLLAFLEEAERRYVSHEALVEALKQVIKKLGDDSWTSAEVANAKAALALAEGREP